MSGGQERFRRKDRQQPENAARSSESQKRLRSPPARATSPALKSMVFTMQSPPEVRSARTPRIGGGLCIVKHRVSLKNAQNHFVGVLQNVPRTPLGNTLCQIRRGTARADAQAYLAKVDRRLTREFHFWGKCAPRAGETRGYLKPFWG